MYHLATVFPRVRTVRLPLSRDQIILLVAAVNELFLGLDTYLAHSVQDINGNEWIPIIFGTIAGILLIFAGVIALRQRALATIIANLVFLSSIIVGLMGIIFHLGRTVLLESPAGAGEAVTALIWAPPVLGPLFFVLIGALGISAAWVEDSPDSGTLKLLGDYKLHLPYSKTRAYFFIVGIMILATLISSVLDHARFRLDSPFVWLPLIAGLFGLTTTLYLGIIEKPNQQDLVIHVMAMIALILVGVIGFLLHTETNLIPRGTILVERFLRGSPLLAPLLFANVGLLGLLVLLDPAEHDEPS